MKDENSDLLLHFGVVQEVVQDVTITEVRRFAEVSQQHSPCFWRHRRVGVWNRKIDQVPRHFKAIVEC